MGLAVPGSVGGMKSIGLGRRNGVNLQRNLQFCIVILPDPSTFTKYWSFCLTSIPFEGMIPRLVLNSDMVTDGEGEKPLRVFCQSLAFIVVTISECFFSIGKCLPPCVVRSVFCQ